MNVCHFIPIRLSENNINQRFKEIQKVLCYAVSIAQSGDTVFTQDSATVTFSGTGTQADPLTATINTAGLGAALAANPSVTVGLTVKNGTAGTLMRSDAAPALDQTIVPTWTGIHTFASPSAVNTIRLISGVPRIAFLSTGNIPTGSISAGIGQFIIAAENGIIQLKPTAALVALTIALNGQMTSSFLAGTGTRMVVASSTGALSTQAIPTDGAGDPSGLIGLVAVPGTATTHLRSDGRHAIDQNIDPIWTGIHTFKSNPTFEGDFISLDFKDAASDTTGFINFGDGVPTVPASIYAEVAEQIRISLGTNAAATFTFGNAGQFGLGNPVAFGTAGQVLTSGGPTGAATWATPAPGVLPANPGATIGLTAKIGTADTFMRSDSAYALEQTIVPTWTGLHTFGSGLVSNPAGATAVSGLNNTPSATFPTALFQKVENGDGTITGAVFPLDCMVLRCNYASNAIKVGQGINLKFQMQQASTLRESFRIAAIADTVGGTASHAEFWVQNTISIQAQTLKSTGQLQLNQYTTVGSFAGTPVGHLAFDSTGNVITVAVPTSASAANPTNLIGMTANNGSLGTFLRSDATHAIDPAIVPVWTQPHTWKTPTADAMKFWADTSQISFYDSIGTTFYGYIVNNPTGMIIGSDLPRTIDLQTGGTPKLSIATGGAITIANLTGTGSRQVVASSTGVLSASTTPIGQATISNHATGPVAITAADSGFVYTNDGASGAIQLNLPVATVGLIYDFANVVGGAATIAVHTNGTDTIINGTQTIGTIATSNEIGDSIRLVCYTPGKWVGLFDNGGSFVISV